MKNVYLNLYIKLPNDFDGGVNEALEYYLHYRKEKKYSEDFQRIIENQLPTTEEETKAIEIAANIINTIQFREFLKVIEMGYNVHGFGTFFNYDEETEEQEYLDIESIN